MSSFIELNDVSFAYNNEADIIKNNVINNINLQIFQGEFIALIGHNGCGKSTLSKMFNALIIPQFGDVIVDGINTKNEDALLDIRKSVGLVLQNPDNQIVASIVEEDVAFGPENLGVEPKVIRKRVDDALKAVGMYEYRDSAPYKLSGGQKQRVAIAGIIAMLPKCIILDEPTSMLDPRGRKEVMDTIIKLNKEKGITVILITHYMEEVVRADRVLVMNKGSILLDDTPRNVFSNVELMEHHNMAIPQATKLLSNLRKSGIDISCNALNETECVNIIEDYIKGLEGEI